MVLVRTGYKPDEFIEGSESTNFRKSFCVRKSLRASSIVKKEKEKMRGSSKGSVNYHSYINSRRWAKRRRAYYSRNPNICTVCGTREEVKLHHSSYERLGNELDSDLVPLCRSHHKAFHVAMGTSKGNMKQETVDFIEVAKFEIEAQNVLNLVSRT